MIQKVAAAANEISDENRSACETKLYTMRSIENNCLFGKIQSIWKKPALSS